jgi:hypothetical protein
MRNMLPFFYRKSGHRALVMWYRISSYLSRILYVLNLVRRKCLMNMSPQSIAFLTYNKV